MKYLSPAFLLTIFGLWMAMDVFGWRPGGGEPRLSSYIIDLFVTPNLVAWLSVGFILTILAFVILLLMASQHYRKPLEEKL